MIAHACEYCGKIREYKCPSFVKRFCSHKCSNRWKWENVRKRADTTQLVCEECGKKFFIEKSKVRAREKHCKIKFCSRECYRKHNKTKEKICPICRKSFAPSNSKTIFCSNKCRITSYAVGEKVCPNCGTKFIPQRSKTKFCSAHCRNAFAHKRYLATGHFWYENGYKIIVTIDGHKKEHIFVMENYIGRKLKPDEVVHHKNGCRTDNRLENLQLMTRGEHSRLHRLKEVQDNKPLFGREPLR